MSIQFDYTVLHVGLLKTCCDMDVISCATNMFMEIACHGDVVTCPWNCHARPRRAMLCPCPCLCLRYAMLRPKTPVQPSSGALPRRPREPAPAREARAAASRAPGASAPPITMIDAITIMMHDA